MSGFVLVCGFEDATLSPFARRPHPGLHTLHKSHASHSCHVSCPGFISSMRSTLRFNTSDVAVGAPRLPDATQHVPSFTLYSYHVASAVPLPARTTLALEGRGLPTSVSPRLAPGSSVPRAIEEIVQGPPKPPKPSRG